MADSPPRCPIKEKKKLNPKKIVLPIIMALSLVLLAQSIEASLANPIPTPLIEVKSPHNYRIYPTGTVPV